MADRRLQSILDHLSPPVTTPTAPAPLHPRSERGHSTPLNLECRASKSPREAQLLESVVSSHLRRFHIGAESESPPELSLAPCRAKPTLLDMENPDTSSDHGDGEDELTKTVEAVRSGITSASTVSTSGAPGLATPRARSAASCEFCDIVQGSAPCFKLYEDELCLCILDINPLSFGHSLVLPKAHFPCLEATPPQVAAAMCAAVPVISSALLAATRCDSFNMLVNSGVAAGQVIMHTHFHIIPRCKGDGLWKSESATRKPMRKVQEAKSLAHMVRTKLSSVAQPATSLGFNREGLS